MKKLLIMGVVVAGAAFLGKRVVSSSGGVDFARMIERMPEDAPPKWMFRNITAIRENTERILELLEARQASAGAESSPHGVAATTSTPDS